jgi:hypothetical protein
VGDLNHPLSDGPLPFGELAFGQRHYLEFACSRETFEWLSEGGMTHLDGVPVVLQLMDVCVGGANVIAKIWQSPEILDGARELQASQWVAA